MTTPLVLSLLLFMKSVSAVPTGPYCALAPRGTVPDISTSLSGAGGGSITNPSAEDVIASAWYPGWLSDDYPLDRINWEKYNVITWAFAATTPDPSIISLDPADEAIIPQFVSMARANSTTPLISIGGWTSSRYFSTAVGSAANRTAFVNAVVGLVQKWNFGGVDFDWEYPNRIGLSCNAISPSDSANFLLFLQELRQHSTVVQMEMNLVVTAAVGITPFAGPDGSPMQDVAAFAEVLDYIEIMAYDVWGSWSSTAGPNAPLNDTCLTTQPAQGSAVSAVTAWTQANFPIDQIILGVASYGRAFHVLPSSITPAAATNASVGSDPSTGNLTTFYPPFDKSIPVTGDKWDDGAGVDVCGDPVAAGGIYDFWGLVDAGYLDANGTAGNSSVMYGFDECSQTPALYDASKDVMIYYDDARSFAAKGNFISDYGLRGFAMWHAAGDYNSILIDAISDAMAIERVCDDQ